MNTAMHIMSIQHQLVLAIGKNASIQEMLQQFLQLCGSSLNATNCHIFLLKDECGNIRYQLEKNEAIKLSHNLSFPMRKNGKLSSQCQALEHLVNGFFQGELTTQVLNIDSTLYYSFKIRNFGVLTVERKKTLSQDIQHALIPVLKKLATSTISLINHKALVVEVKTRKKFEEKIHYQASHDFLTGLYNRLKMEKCLLEAIAGTEENKKSAALILINLTKFKDINDAMGYHVGDKVLYKMANRLKDLLAETAKIARFDGQEFIVLLDHLPYQNNQALALIKATISSIINSIETPIELSEGRFSLSCFIGYEQFHDNSKGVQDILKNASIAMYEASKKGKAKALPFNQIMYEQLNTHISYTKEIKLALLNNEFELHYQPQFDHAKNIIGAEALLRWNHPIRGYESPALYIPIAEESDLIMQIGDYVLKQACLDINKLMRHPLPDSFKQISINISAKQLAAANFVETIMAAVKESEIEPSRLKIEITESIMMSDIDHSITCLETLHQLGVECAIDDFGTRYSSLTYLKRLPASLLKIDRSFVTDIHIDKSNHAIASMIIKLANSLDMDIIAEGVETKEELDCLVELGCDNYQGYYFCRALPFDNLLDMIIHSTE